MTCSYRNRESPCPRMWCLIIMRQLANTKLGVTPKRNQMSIPVLRLLERLWKISHRSIIINRCLIYPRNRGEPLVKRCRSRWWTWPEPAGTTKLQTTRSTKPIRKYLRGYLVRRFTCSDHTLSGSQMKSRTWTFTLSSVSEFLSIGSATIIYCSAFVLDYSYERHHAVMTDRMQSVISALNKWTFFQDISGENLAKCAFVKATIFNEQRKCPVTCSVSFGSGLEVETSKRIKDYIDALPMSEQILLLANILRLIINISILIKLQFGTLSIFWRNGSGSWLRRPKCR